MTTLHTLTIDLKPFGKRFQPTGFPDLGAAEYQVPIDEETAAALHVESPQSCANHLEAMTWDDGTNAQVAELEGIPYVNITDGDGKFLTSSRLEPHRLASGYIMDGTFANGQKGTQYLAELFGAAPKTKGQDPRRLYREVFKLDPMSLIHGVFFAQKWSWQPKVARAITMFIDAENVKAAYSGGVKTDRVDNTGGDGKGDKKASQLGLGMVPFSRIEYVAQSITAYIAIDQTQIASYGLGEDAERLLSLLIEFELAKLLDDGHLRLRTACMLEIGDVSPAGGAGGFASRPLAQVLADLPAAINACSDLFNGSGVTEVTWTQK